MKIVHISLCGPVSDGFTYQDNLLPKYHKKIGNEVVMITSKFIWNSSGKMDIDSRKEYFNENGIKTIRLSPILKARFSNKFKLFNNLYTKIESEKPDILFVHGVQFLNIFTIIKYKKKNPQVKIYIDNHADFSNSATNWFSLNLLHKGLWKFCALKAEPFAEKFFGVLPARAEFLERIYGIKKENIELLLMGVDDDEVEKLQKSINNIRNDFKILQDDFLIVSGGKFDSAKLQIITLIHAIKKMGPHVKLIFFGSLNDEVKSKIHPYIDGKKIIYFGWANVNQTYRLLDSADLVVFPGRHSTLWEQAAGIGKPLLVKKWKGTEHINIDGNCVFLESDSKDEMYNKLKLIINNSDLYSKMLINAKKKGMEKFSYKNIALKSIGFDQK